MFENIKIEAEVRREHMIAGLIPGSIAIPVGMGIMFSVIGIMFLIRTIVYSYGFWDKGTIAGITVTIIGIIMITHAYVTFIRRGV